jgi:hypothetical protein
MAAYVACASSFRDGVLGAQEGPGERRETLLIFRRSQIGRGCPARDAVPFATLDVERRNSPVMELVGVHAFLPVHAAPSLDHPVGSSQQRLRDGEAKGLRVLRLITSSNVAARRLQVSTVAQYLAHRQSRDTGARDGVPLPYSARPAR